MKSWLGVSFLTSSVLACASLRPVSHDDFKATGRIITAGEIATTDARTAWDVVEHAGMFRSMSEPSSGRAGMRSRRGKSSILLPYADEPRLIVDGARVSDPRYLRDIPAASIAFVEILGGIAGAAREGLNSGGGVIYVVSKRGP